MDKLDMLQSRYGKMDEYGWWDLEGNPADAGTQFTLTVFKEECHTRGVHLTLAAPEHQKMNRQVKVTQRTLHKIAHSIMVHSSVSGVYIHFALLYTTYCIFLVLPIKDLINKNGDGSINSTKRFDK